jgi:hypothetical protein
MPTDTQTIRWRAERDIIEELGRVPSSREMQKLLKDKYGLEVNHNTVNKDLKQDLETLTEDTYKNQKTGILKTLDDELNAAHDIAMNDSDSEIRLKAMNTVSRLQKTKTDILIRFRKAQVEMNKEEAPVYTVVVEEPKEVKKDDIDDNSEKNKK